MSGIFSRRYASVAAGYMPTIKRSQSAKSLSSAMPSMLPSARALSATARVRLKPSTRQSVFFLMAFAMDPPMRPRPATITVLLIMCMALMSTNSVMLRESSSRFSAARCRPNISPALRRQSTAVVSGRLPSASMRAARAVSSTSRSLQSG